MVKSLLNSSMQRLAQPSGLYVLFFTEAAERFAYYGMRALLVLYLVNHLHYERAAALKVYATYTALVYVMPLLGGYLADRFLGAKKAIIVGGLLMFLGELLLMSQALLFTGLGLLVVGCGFFKPNISNIVGHLYSAQDPRRDAGFTLFYMGINLGGFLSPFICGTIGEKWGFHYGFLLASLGLVVGLGIFLSGQRFLVLQRVSFLTSKSIFNLGAFLEIFLYTALSVFLVWGSLKAYELLTPWVNVLEESHKWAFFGGLGLLLVTIWGLGRKIFKAFTREAKTPAKVSLTTAEKQETMVILIMALAVIFFWVAFEQAGGTMNLFASTKTARLFLGKEIPASLFQAINPLIILLLTPFFLWLWRYLDNSRYALGTPLKMCIGLAFLGAGCLLMFVANQHSNSVGLVSPLWLLSVYFLETVGELCISPVGLSMVTKLAPLRLSALLLGVWFVFIGFAGYLAGRLEEIVRHFNWPLFGVLTITSWGSALVLLLLNPFLKKWMHGKA